MRPDIINIADTTMQGFQFDAIPYVQQCTIFTDIDEALSAELPMNALAVLVDGTLPGLDPVDAKLQLLDAALSAFNQNLTRPVYNYRNCNPNIVWRKAPSAAQRDALDMRNVFFLGEIARMVRLDGWRTTNGIPLHEISAIAAFVKRLRYLVDELMGTPLTARIWSLLCYSMRQTQNFLYQSGARHTGLVVREIGDMLAITTENCIIQITRNTDQEKIAQGIAFDVAIAQQVIHTLLNIFEPPRLATSLPTNKKAISHE